MRHADLRSEDDLTRETMHIACIYGWISKGWDHQRYGCHIDKSPFPDSGDLIVDHMEASRIVWAMGDQPKPIDNWLFHAYGNDQASDWMWHGRMVAYGLWKQHFDGKMGRTNYQLVWMAVQDFRNRSLGRPGASEEVLMAGMGGKKWAWHKHWKPKFDDILDQLHSWDVTGVANVSITIRQVREGRA